MKRKIIRFVSLFMAVHCLLSTQVFALNDGNLQVLDNSEAFVRTSHTSDLNKNGKYLYGVDVLAKAGATTTYCSIVIQQRQSNGEYIDVPGTFRSDLQDGRYASVGDEWYVYSGYWYRTQATFIVNINGEQYKVVDNSVQFWYPPR